MNIIKRPRRSSGFIGAYERYDSLATRHQLREAKKIVDDAIIAAALLSALRDMDNPHLHSTRRLTNKLNYAEPLHAACGDDEMMSDSPAYPASA